MAHVTARRPRKWPYTILQGLLLLALSILFAIVIDLVSRPPRIPTQAPLFQGVTYTRLVRTDPRRLVIHIVAVDLTAPGVRILVTPGDSACGMETCAMTTRDFLEKNGLQLAINGSFFSPFVNGHGLWDYYPQTGDPTDVSGLAISNGAQYSEDDPLYAKICFTGSRAQITADACPEGTTQALAGKDILVRDGKAVHFDYDHTPNPRTALAVGEDGKRLWLIAVDGRQKGYSEGVDLNELADLVAETGAAQALNLDGGGSTTLVMSRKGVQTLNAPIHTRIPQRERPVANHLGVYALPLH